MIFSDSDLKGAKNDPYKHDGITHFAAYLWDLHLHEGISRGALLDWDLFILEDHYRAFTVTSIKLNLVAAANFVQFQSSLKPFLVISNPCMIN